MSKLTETTNERVPRDIVRIGTTVGKHTEAHGSVGKHTEAHGSVGERMGGWTKRCRRGTEGVPKRAGRSEREDAGRGG